MNFTRFFGGLLDRLRAVQARAGSGYLRFLAALDSRPSAMTSVLLGGASIAAGAALICVPAGFVVAGCLLVAFGLLFVDYDAPDA